MPSLQGVNRGQNPALQDTASDLNQRKTGNKKYKDNLTVSPESVPICQKGLEMKDNGYDRTRGRRKYRCPLLHQGIQSRVYRRNSLSRKGLRSFLMIIEK